jgi:hypothetical protein
MLSSENPVLNKLIGGHLVLNRLVYEHLTLDTGWDFPEIPDSRIPEANETARKKLTDFYIDFMKSRTKPSFINNWNEKKQKRKRKRCQKVSSMLYADRNIGY